MKRWIGTLPWWFFAFAQLCLAAEPERPIDGPVRIASEPGIGSELVPRLIQSFQQHHPAFAFELETLAGSMDQSASDADVRIGISSNNADPLLARDRIVLIFHPSNVVTALSSNAVRELLAGALPNWNVAELKSQLTAPVTIYALEKPTWESSFTRQVMNGRAIDPIRCRRLGNTDQIIAAVHADRGAVGIVPRHAALSAGTGVWMCELPTPLELAYRVQSNSRPAATAFKDFIVGDACEKFIRALGFER